MSQSPRFDQLVRNAKSAVREISPEDALRLQLEGAVLIDVREADEYAKGHAAQAIQLGRGVLELKIEQAVPDPTTPIVCYCGGGSRSALSADSLQRWVIQMLPRWQVALGLGARKTCRRHKTLPMSFMEMAGRAIRSRSVVIVRSCANRGASRV